MDAARVRSGAYFNLAMMGEALSPPKVDGCLALPPPPGCARPLHACAYAASSYGTGGGLKTSFLVVARTAGAARIQGERTEGSVLYDVDPPGALPDAESREPESVAAEVYGVLPLAEEQEMFVGRCYEFAERACTEDEAAGAAVEACLKARGCAGGAGCDAWDACVDTSCPADVKARVAESQKACDAQAAALTHARCRLVAADACAGVAATVCEDAEGRSRRRAVHEVVLAP